MRVRGVGSLNFTMQAATDFSVKLTGVYVTEGKGFSLLSLDDAQSRQSRLITMACTSFNKQLTFPRSETGSYQRTARIAPTPPPKTVNREQVEPYSLCHVYTGRFDAEGSCRVHLEVETTYPSYSHLISASNQDLLLTRANIYPVVCVGRVTSDMIFCAVVRHTKLATWWSYSAFVCTTHPTLTS